MESLTVACVLTSDGPFDKENVKVTHAMCNRNIRQMERFVLLSDRGANVPGVECVKAAHEWSSKHARLELFRSMFPENQRILFLHLGCVILDQLDLIVERKEPVVRTEDANVVLWTANDLYDVYRNFARRMRLELTVAEVMKIHVPHVATFPPEHVVSYHENMTPGSVKIVTFEGVPDVTIDWVREAYRIEEEYVPLRTK